MSAISFEFPYRFRYSDGRKLAYPEVKVQIKTFLGNQTYNFLFDSGADMTTAPDYMIDLFEIPAKKLKKSRSFGVSGIPIESFDSVIPVKINTIKFELPITFVPNKDIPLLLGKEGIFDRFNILFDNTLEKIVFYVR